MIWMNYFQIEKKMARKRRSKTNTTFFTDIEDAAGEETKKWKKTDKWREIVF